DLTLRRPPASPFFPYTTLFRSWPRRSDKEGWVALGVRSDHRAVRPGGGVRAVLARRGAAGRAATVQPGEAGALRVRYRADPAAGGRRPGAGEVLPHRDDVHHLRYRGGVPDPVGGGLRPTGAWRVPGGGAVHRGSDHRVRVRVAPRWTGVGLVPGLSTRAASEAERSGVERYSGPSVGGTARAASEAEPSGRAARG